MVLVFCIYILLLIVIIPIFYTFVKCIISYGGIFKIYYLERMFKCGCCHLFVLSVFMIFIGFLLNNPQPGCYINVSTVPYE